MRDFDVVVIGGGPAGMFASIFAARAGAKTCLLEGNASLGRKLLISGSSRCNLAVDTAVEEFIAKFGRAANFLKPSAYMFSLKDIREFFGDFGLCLVAEGRRIFPETVRSRDVLAVLEKAIRKEGVFVKKNASAISIKQEGEGFFTKTTAGAFSSRAVVLACGGATYKNTGSDGNGFRLAIRLGHKITRLLPALAALTTVDDVSSLKGITLKGVEVAFGRSKERGDIIFTHFGVSGPLIHNISARVLSLKEKTIYFDFLPHISQEALAEAMEEMGDKNLSNKLSAFLPKRVSRFIINRGAGSHLQAAMLAKRFVLKIKGSLPFDYAMVTSGGIDRKEAFAKTMMSKIRPGLFFAGEILDIDGPSGGYNIQAAICTGVCAGRSAALFAKEKRGE